MTHTHRICKGVNVAAGFLLAALTLVFLSPVAAAGAMALLPVVGTPYTGAVGVSSVAGRQIPTVSRVVDEYEMDDTPFTSVINRIGGLNPEQRAAAGMAPAARNLGGGDLANPRSIEIEILERSPLPRQATASGSTSAGSASAAVVVNVDAGHVIVPGDVLRIFDNATDATLSYYVSASTATSLTIQAMPKVTANARGTYNSPVAFGTVPAIADDALISWIGNVKSEADAASRPRAIEPETRIQFIQTLDSTEAMSDHAQRISVYGTDSLLNEVTRSMTREFKRSREAAYLFNGEKSVFSRTNLNGETQKFWAMRGVYGHLTNTITLPDNPTVSDISTFVYDAHTGVEGVVDKFLFGGTDLMARFDSVVSAHPDLRIDMDEDDIGVKVTRLHGTKGGVNLVWHPLFDVYDKADEGVLIDMRYIGRSVLQEVTERGGTDKQKEYGAMVDRDMWQLISKEALVMHKASGARAVHKKVVLG